MAADRPLGILMLDTRFPRIVGDIGNAETFPFPVIFQKLEGVGPSDAVAAAPDRPRIRAALAANAKALAEKGAPSASRPAADSWRCSSRRWRWFRRCRWRPRR
jgi:hypothetical protein